MEEGKIVLNLIRCTSGQPTGTLEHCDGAEGSCPCGVSTHYHYWKLLLELFGILRRTKKGFVCSQHFLRFSFFRMIDPFRLKMQW